ncbi:hypothetical protein [Streptomyces sp. NPDC056323]|uniref:hypothetical protein n=1 Tax=Streptomyces sp. NPDC056323 TaxID=3345784 RepID=UPI0035E0ACFE
MSEMTSISPVPHTDDADSDRLTSLLDRAATGRDDQAWSNLWTELYHNGSLQVSHPLVLPALTDMAEGDHFDTAAAALHLAGALLVQADQRYETRKLRQQHASEVGRLLAASNRCRQATADRNDYCHLLEAVLNLEGGIHWAEELIWGIVSEEYELECPDPDGCAAVWVIIGEQGFFSSSEDHALSDDAEILPLHPAAPPRPRRPRAPPLRAGPVGRPRGCGARPAHAFGEATCPQCERRFSIVGQVVARSS